MAEIKSTLDLVMEKTKNLSFSDKERQEQKNKEIESRIRGLLQKFQDQIIAFDRFKSEYQVLHQEYRLSGDKLLIKEICGQIEFGKDNQKLFELLAQFKVSDFDGIVSVLQDFHDVIDTAAQKRSKILKDELAEAHFISGSAVVPNLEIDEAWRKNFGEIRAKFEEELDRQKNRLLSEQK
jgi:ribosomal protein S20